MRLRGGLFRRTQVGLFYQGHSQLEGHTQLADETWDAIFTTPARLGMGASARVTSWLSGRIGGQYLFREESDNQLALSAAALWHATDALTTSISVHRTGRSDYMDLSPVLDDDPMTARFLAAGFAYRVGVVRLDLAVSDSRLLSSPKNRQTLVKAGASVAL